MLSQSELHGDRGSVAELGSLLMASVGWLPFIVMLPCCCAAQEQYGWVSPNDTDGLYLFVGELLTLNCTVDSSYGYYAWDLEFVFNSDYQEEDEVISTEYLHFIGNYTLQLVRNVTSEGDSGTYSCWIHNNIYVDEQTIYVPKWPLVQNISCFVYDWDESLRCRWNFSVTDLDPHVTVHVGIIPVNGGGMDPCPQTTSLRVTECAWDNFRADSEYCLNITVKIETQQLAEPSNTALHYVHTNSIVKPAAVINFNITNKTSKCVTLEWDHPRKYRPKIYRVFSVSGSWTASVDDDHVHRGNSSDTRMKLCDLKPYTTYTFVIQCHPDGSEGFWSEPEYVTVTTEETEPESSFPVTPGSYMLQDPCINGTHDVTIFWNSVPESRRNGKIIGYLLINDHERIEKNVPSPTSAVIPNVPCNSSVSVRIFARTQAGASKNNSRIQIFPENAPLLDLAVNITGGKIQLVWDGSQAQGMPVLPTGNGLNEADTKVSHGSDGSEHFTAGDDKVTFFWCTGNIQTKTCEGEIQSIRSNVSAGAVEIPLTDIQPVNYLFGISIGGRAISWTDCLFQEQASVKTPSDLQVDPGSAPGQLVIRWAGTKCSYSYPVKVSGYVVDVCDENPCRSYEAYQVHGAGSNSMVYYGTPGTEYFVTVKAFTLSGKKSPPSSPQSGQAQKLDQSSSDNLTLIWIPVVVVPLLILFLYVVKRYKNQQAKFNRPTTVGRPNHRHRKRQQSPAREPLNPLTAAVCHLVHITVDGAVGGSSDDVQHEGENVIELDPTVTSDVNSSAEEAESCWHNSNKFCQCPLRYMSLQDRFASKGQNIGSTEKFHPLSGHSLSKAEESVQSIPMQQVQVAETPTTDSSEKQPVLCKAHSPSVITGEQEPLPSVGLVQQVFDTPTTDYVMSSIWTQSSSEKQPVLCKAHSPSVITGEQEPLPSIGLERMPGQKVTRRDSMSPYVRYEDALTQNSAFASAHGHTASHGCTPDNAHTSAHGYAADGGHISTHGLAADDVHASARGHASEGGHISAHRHTADDGHITAHGHVPESGHISAHRHAAAHGHASKGGHTSAHGHAPEGGHISAHERGDHGEFSITNSAAQAESSLESDNGFSQSFTDIP